MRREAFTDAAVTAAALATCFLAWLVFWDLGAIGLVSHDWPKEAYYYDVLREALTTGRLPFYIDRDAQGTSWFLAIPEVLVSPQLLLLPLLPNGAFATANGIILWLVGVAGCLLYRRRYQVAMVPFLFVLFLFSFNGHIIGHLAVGHSMWVGYFLSPFAILATFRLVEGSTSSRDALLLGLVLAGMMLQGAFHLAVYFALLAGVLALLAPRRLAAPVALAFAACGPLAAVKIVPALLAFGELDRSFMSGYPGLGIFLDGLTAVRPTDTPPLGSFTEHRLGWWEYDAYLGVAGLLFVTVFAFRPLKGQRDGWLLLVQACLVLIVLSFGEVIYLLSLLHVPVLGQERVASRIFVAPLVCLLFLAGRGYTERAGNAASPSDGRPPAVSVLAVLGLALTIGGLLAHLLKWRIVTLEAAPREPWQLHMLEVIPNPFYERLWLGSLALSVIAWIAAVSYLVTRRRLPDLCEARIP